jgi:hypothetical protein
MIGGQVVWQIPLSIVSRGKYHCFDEGISLCCKYQQVAENYEIPSGEILSNPHFACQVCYQRWKKMFAL